MATPRFLRTLLIALCMTAQLAAQSTTDPRQALDELGQTEGAELWGRLLELSDDVGVATVAEAIIGNDEVSPPMRLGARWVRNRAADNGWPAETVQVLEHLYRKSGLFGSRSPGAFGAMTTVPAVVDGVERMPPRIEILEGEKVGDALMLLAALHDPSPDNAGSVLTHLDPLFEPLGSDPSAEWRGNDSMFASKYALIGMHQLINRQRDAVLDYVIMRELEDVPQVYGQYNDMCLSYIAYHRVAVDAMIPRLIMWAETGEGPVTKIAARQALAVIKGDLNPWANSKRLRRARAFPKAFKYLRPNYDGDDVETIIKELKGLRNSPVIGGGVGLYNPGSLQDSDDTDTSERRPDTSRPEGRIEAADVLPTRNPTESESEGQ